MNSANFLEMLPLSGIEKYSGDRRKDGVPFMGYPRQPPLEKDKLILMNDPLGPRPVVLEFKLEDVLYVEEIPQAVTESGEGVPLVKLWIRKGAHGMILEPFEVSEPVQFAAKTQELRDLVLKSRPQAGL
jgi:hypothetical protein